MSSSPPRRSIVTPRMIMWFVGMAAGFAVMYFSLPKQKLGGPAGPIPTDDTLKPTQRSLCETKLIKWVQSVNPERLQYNTDIESREIELNRYWSTCGPSTDTKPLVTDLKPIESQLSGEPLKLTLATRFTRRDVEHIRQSMLLSRIAERAAKEYKEDLDRAVALIGLISPQIEPIPAQQSAERPFTPFDCLLIGQGTPFDRAWVLAEAVRQLHLDSVVLTTESNEVPPLLGVIVEGEVYLFDSLTGWPIPAAGESQRKTIFRVPATLKDTLAQDGILRQLDLDGRPYPWSSEMLKSARLGVVGTSSTWSPRMAELQFQWPNNQMCVVYDGLGPSSSISKGLLERVSQSLAPLGYPADRVKVWEYPEQQFALYDSKGAEAAPYMAPLIDVMSGPRSFLEEVDQKTGGVNVTVQKSKRPLQHARVQHLLGHRVDAIGGYLPMMRADRLTLKSGGAVDSAVQQAMDLNRKLAEKAVYWMASVQFENADYEACEGTLRIYTKDFPLGELREAAVMQHAACLEKAEKYADAEKVLATLGTGPNELKRALLVRRLKELQGTPAAAETPAAPSESPAKPEAKPEAPTQPTAPAVSSPAAEATPPPPPQAESIR